MRHIPAATSLLLAFLAAATTASAQDGATGHWIVTGRVAGFAFTLACDFQQVGQALTGVCADTATSDAKVKAGRRHVLTRGHAEGDTVTWTYGSSFLFSHFDVDYNGELTGDRMAGKITAQDRTGAFTAQRAAP